MIDTYVVFDTVEAWQLEEGDPALLDGEHVIVTGKTDTADPDEILVTGISEETGESTDFPLVWDQPIDLWRISDDEE